MEQRYHSFHAPILSFFSGDFYHDVACRWKGMGFLYLFLLLAVTWVAPIVKTYFAFTTFMATGAPALLEQFPALSIRDGEVSIDQPEPHFITDSESGQVLAAFDTTDKITSINDVPNAWVLVTRNSVIIRNNPKKIETHPLPPDLNFDLDQAKINRFVEEYQKPFAVGAYFVCLIVSFVYRIIQAFIYAAIAMLIANTLSKTLQFSGAARIAVMAVTPVILLNTVLGALGMDMLAVVGCMWLVICGGITVGYLFFAVNSVRPVDPFNPMAPVTGPDLPPPPATTPSW